MQARSDRLAFQRLAARRLKCLDSFLSIGGEDSSPCLQEYRRLPAKVEGKLGWLWFGGSELGSKAYASSLGVFGCLWFQVSSGGGRS